MMENTQTKLVINQFIMVLFLEEIPIKFNKIKLVSTITDEMPIFNKDPFILPLPENAPTDIPRIILNGEQHSCQISFKKIEFFLESTAVSLSDSYDSFSRYARQLANIIILNDFTISRIGFVVRGTIEEAADVFLSANYLHGKRLLAEAFDLGFLLHPEFNKSIINKWVKLNSKDNIINLTLDYNTLQENACELDKDKIDKFFLSLNVEFSKELRELLVYEIIK